MSAAGVSYLASEWTGHKKFELFGLSQEDATMSVVSSCTDSFSSLHRIRDQLVQSKTFQFSIA